MCHHILTSFDSITEGSPLYNRIFLCLSKVLFLFVDTRLVTPGLSIVKEMMS